MEEKEVYLMAERLFESGDYERALAVYINLASAGSCQAKAFVGWMYECGFGAIADINEAEKWYREAALHESAFAQFRLAKLCSRTRRREEAINWYEKAANNNFSPALFRLGWIYEVGRGVTADREKAMRLYTKAFALGHVFAQRELGKLMMRGYAGVVRVPCGVKLFFGALYRGVKIGVRNENDERFMT